jgi:GNAT superfamily N-acetyltransferase
VVDAELRGRGIGRELLERTELLVAQQGGRQVYAENSRDQYRPTRTFYERCGYRQEAFLNDFYAPGDGKVVFVKVLPSGEPATPKGGPR